MSHEGSLPSAGEGWLMRTLFVVNPSGAQWLQQSSEQTLLSPFSRALHIHSPAYPWASLLTICAALCTRPRQSTPKKRSTPSSLLPGKANPRLFPAPLAPAKFCNMMAEVLRWVGLSLGELGTGLNEAYHQIGYNCGFQISTLPFLLAFLNTSSLTEQSQFWLQPMVVFSRYRWLGGNWEFQWSNITTFKSPHLKVTSMEKVSDNTALKDKRLNGN